MVYVYVLNIKSFKVEITELLSGMGQTDPAHEPPYDKTFAKNVVIFDVICMYFTYARSFR